ncbi:lytic transglycosylase domain-containing protein [Symbiobacterium terraclitae]|uniref:lytic transglycosylase domain-containing protein n=1 Tax=Symbiobacterium terraclitae TaxID=557451 RepID=UPI0035B557A8
MSFRRFCRQWIAPALVGSGITLLVTMIPRPGQSATTLAAAPPPAAQEVSSLTRERAAEMASQATLAALEVNLNRRIADLELRVADLEAYWAELDRIADLVPADYRQLVVDTARAHGLDPRALAALGWVESRWTPDVVGAAGEVGIMQILPETGAWIAERLGVEEYDLRDPRTNVKFGAAYLAWLIRENHGSIDAAFAAYNGGPNAMERKPAAARSYVDRVRTAMARTE